MHCWNSITKFNLMTPVDLSAAIKSDIRIAYKNQFHDLRSIAAIMLVSKGVFGKLQYSPCASSCAHYEQHILHATSTQGILANLCIFANILLAIHINFGWPSWGLLFSPQVITIIRVISFLSCAVP